MLSLAIALPIQLLLAFSPPGGGSPLPGSATLARQRERMVTYQLRGRDITDERVLSAMGRVPRHLFVPPPLAWDAYADRPLPIGCGQTISQPYIVALMTQLLDLPPRGAKVLEVGTGSGYQAAVLSALGTEVYTMEIIPELAQSAAERLQGYGAVHVMAGDGYHGWKEHAPFNGILVTAAAPEIPAPLVEQLAEGGRMVIPVGNAFVTQSLILVEKRNGAVTRRSVIPVSFVPLTGDHRRPVR